MHGLCASVGQSHIQLFKAVAKKVGVAVSEQIEASMATVTRILVVAVGALIAHRIIRMPDPYFGIVQNLLISICIVAVFTIIQECVVTFVNFWNKRRGGTRWVRSHCWFG